jgi:dienelactone hydrolase
MTNMRTVLFAALFALSVAHIAKAAETKECNLVKGVKFDAELFSSEGESKNLGILVLGGSEGGIPKRLALGLANEGYPSLALGYFKTKQTPGHLDMIPLEYFDEPIKWFSERPEVRGKNIIVIGGSKGGELALLLASRKPEIRGVIAIVPSFVVFQGIPKVFWPPKSSWSYKSKPVPFVPYDTTYYFSHSKEIKEGKLVGYYQESLKNQEAVKKAAIQVEKINGPVLLFSGTNDTMWPSTEMCEIICRRLREKNFKHKYEHIKYEKAGHTLNEHFMMGGTKDGNKQARMDAKKKTLEFLDNLSAKKANAPDKK